MEEKIKNSIEKCVDALFDENGEHLSNKNTCYIPSVDEIYDIVEEIKQVLYPRYFTFDKTVTKEDSRAHLESIAYRLEKQIELAYSYEISQNCGVAINCDGIKEKSRTTVSNFIEKLPEIFDLLKYDIQATLEGDPAARNIDIILIAYPGIKATLIYRLANVLFKLGVPLIPRIMTEYAHSKTGIDIHPGATIGKRFVIDHGTGIVIGETTFIGDNVKLYQGVTLGAISLKNSEALVGVKRHPTLKNNVTIYAGATILGGETIIGEGATIGSSAFITKSVEPNVTVAIEKPKLRML